MIPYTVTSKADGNADEDNEGHSTGEPMFAYYLLQNGINLGNTEEVDQAKKEYTVQDGPRKDSNPNEDFFVGLL